MKASATWLKLRAKLIDSRFRSCENCGAAEVRLSLHHRHYEAGKKPWDYPERTLEVLCSRCHGLADEMRRRIVRATGPLHSALAERAIGYMEALDADNADDAPASLRLTSWEYASGVGDVFRLTGDAVAGAADKRGIVSMATLRELRHAR